MKKGAKVDVRQFEALTTAHSFEKTRLQKLREDVLSSHPSLASDDPDLDAILRQETNLDDLEEAAKVLLLKLGKQAKLREKYAKAVGEAKKELDEKKAAHEKAAASARAIVMRVMKEFGFDGTITDGVSSANLRRPNTPRKFVVADPAALPKEFRSEEKVTIYKPDMAKIEQHYAKHGKAPANVEVVENGDILTLK